MAVRHLGLRRSGREAFKPLLGKVLEDRDQAVAIAAIQVAARLGPGALDVAPRLVELRADGDAAVRTEAAIAAWSRVERKVAEASLPLLPRGRGARSRPTRGASACDRGQQGRAGPRAVPWLVPSLGTPRSPSA